MNEVSKNEAPVSFGDYLVTRRIARGGMAEIFCAQEPKGRWVALKVMRSELGHDGLRKDLFEREARISTLLHHPNVVPVFDVGEIEETSFLSMEYVRGRNLSQVLRQVVSLSPAMALWIGRAVAQGLGHAHRLCDEKGKLLAIIHRDVSPGNIMIGFDGAVKILDFGIARINEESSIATQTGILRGKFAYMSPEQASGDNIDARSDIFSLGTLLYEILTGTNCFRASDPIATLERVKRFSPPPPTATRPELPQAIDDILQRCLAKDPNDRFKDGIALAEALASLLSRLDFLGRPKIVSYMETHFAEQRAGEERVFQEDIGRVDKYRASANSQSSQDVAQEQTSSEYMETARYQIGGLLTLEPDSPGHLHAVVSLLDVPSTTDITQTVTLPSVKAVLSTTTWSRVATWLRARYMVGTLTSLGFLMGIFMVLASVFSVRLGATSSADYPTAATKTRLAPVTISIGFDGTETSSTSR